MLDATFYNLLMEASAAIYRAMARQGQAAGNTTPPPATFQIQAGRAESPGWFLLQAAEFDPEPLTVANLRVRDVYGAAGIVGAILELLAIEGWVERLPQPAYGLTESGRAMLARIRERRQRSSERLAPLPVTDLAWLASLLGRLIAASLVSPTPPGTWCLAHSRRRAPAPDSPLLMQIAHYFDDCNAFRDDAHMAAWQPLGVAGYEWEAFDLVCTGAATTATALAEQLAYRGYARHDYATALEHLATRGWLAIEPTTHSYQVTDTGRAIRTKVEHLTDQYFYAPWSCLSSPEITELRELLIRLRDSLNAGR